MDKKPVLLGILITFDYRFLAASRLVGTVIAMTMGAPVLLIATVTLPLILDIPLHITALAGGTIIMDQDTDPIIGDEIMLRVVG